MTQFLTGEALSAKIREVMRGAHPMMSVAFLGPNWVNEIFSGPLPKGLKIICDVTMGATTSPALKLGGAPKNKCLRHLPGIEMHGKIYLSDSGAVIGSANASERALSGSKRIEDGVWISPDSDAYAHVKKELHARYERGSMVDQETLDLAPLFPPSQYRGEKPPEGLTLLECLRDNPDTFNSIRFVCSTLSVPDEVKQEANDALTELDETEVLEHIKKLDYYYDWGMTEKSWPLLFISIHIGSKGRVYLTKNIKMKLVHISKNKDVLISKKIDWREHDAAFGGIPSLADNKKCREELKEIAIYHKDSLDGQILNGWELRNILLG